MAITNDISLRALDERDALEIRKWPEYSGDFKPLDYALREGGWLDTFPQSSTTRRYAACSNGALVGFTLLIDITEDAAEFYIALHPEYTGHGFGRTITVLVLNIAFTQLDLKRVYLKVRDWHRHAISLYEKVGFITTGHKREEIQGAMVNFRAMEISRGKFFETANIQN